MKKLLLTALIITNPLLALTNADAKKIGMQIWKNEASQRIDLLVFWSEREEFPSLGIGHAIWLPAGSTEPYQQQFPALCNYLQKNGVTLPAWLDCAKNSGAPWKTRAEFMHDSTKIAELRKVLAATIDLQTQFIIEQFNKTWPTILEKAPKKQQKSIARKVKLLQSTLLGQYALIDYLNFKGSGINPKEECNGTRWGLLQVLLDMPNNLNEKNVTKSFAVSAAKILVQRIESTAPEYLHLQSLPGWINRVYTYCDPYSL